MWKQWFYFDWIDTSWCWDLASGKPTQLWYRPFTSMNQLWHTVEEILHQLICGGLSRYLQGFNQTRWCRISQPPTVWRMLNFHSYDSLLSGTSTCFPKSSTCWRNTCSTKIKKKTDSWLLPLQQIWAAGENLLLPFANCWQLITTKSHSQWHPPRNFQSSGASHTAPQRFLPSFWTSRTYGMWGSDDENSDFTWKKSGIHREKFTFLPAGGCGEQWRLSRNVTTIGQQIISITTRWRFPNNG